ncbi:hypothetical protein BC828DRAFT_402942 [Blastocladiella britannica]|nr:hypothetical protein BC828DRAFT_402942 [Blastocladiella britannica]
MDHQYPQQQPWRGGSSGRGGRGRGGPYSSSSSSGSNRPQYHQQQQQHNNNGFSGYGNGSGRGSFRGRVQSRGGGSNYNNYNARGGSGGGGGGRGRGNSRGTMGFPGGHNPRDYCGAEVSTDPAHSFQPYPTIPPDEFGPRYVRMNAATPNLAEPRLPLVIPELRMADNEWGDARLDDPASIPPVPIVGWVPINLTNPGARWADAEVHATGLMPLRRSAVVDPESTWTDAMDEKPARDAAGLFPMTTLPPPPFLPPPLPMQQQRQQQLPQLHSQPQSTPMAATGMDTMAHLATANAGNTSAAAQLLALLADPAAAAAALLAMQAKGGFAFPAKAVAHPNAFGLAHQSQSSSAAQPSSALKRPASGELEVDGAPPPKQSRTHGPDWSGRS